MNRKRLTALLSSGFLILCLFSSGPVHSQAPAQIRATDKPFLWRIEGTVPSYLYGTVHVPDARVLELPEVVRRAFDAADVFTAEIPLDSGTQAGLMTKTMLPPGQDLRKLVGESVYGRLVRAITNILGGKVPPGAAEILAAALQPMKPWAAMSQLELLEYMPDVLAGREPLDAMLYGLATKAGKDVGALETVDEQVAVFEGFTMEEQIKLLVSTLDEIEKPQPSGSATRQIVDLYLAGDLNKLAVQLNDEGPDDAALKKKITERLIDSRNLKMTERIAALFAKRPARSYFIAVGTLHYAGDTGIISQLSKKGFKITRLTPADSRSIVRKPAA